MGVHRQTESKRRKRVELTCLIAGLYSLPVSFFFNFRFQRNENDFYSLNRPNFLTVVENAFYEFNTMWETRFHF